MTTGAVNWPADRYRNLASSDTICSNAGKMKSANWISATGRRPFRAIPIAMPTIPASASGVSTTRSGPNRSHRPSVARNTPPFLPMSSPSRTTPGFRSISPESASWIAWTSVIVATGSPFHRDPDPFPLLAEVPGHLRIDVFDQALRSDRGGGLARGHRPLHFLARRLHGRRLQGLVEKALSLEEVAESTDGVFPPPRLDVVRGPVARRVVGRRVRAQSVRQRLDQRRPLPRPGTLQGVARRPDDRKDVVSVHPDARKTVRRCLDRDRGRGGLPGNGHRYGKLIVAAEEDIRGLEDPGEVHRDVEFPGRASAVPEVRHDGDLLAAQFRRVRRTDRLGELGGDGGGNRDDARRPVAPVVGHLPSPRDIGGAAKELTDELGKGIAVEQRRSLVPVGGEDPVPLLQGESRAGLRRFLAGGADVEADPPGPLEIERLVVQRPKEHHLLKKKQERFPVEPGVHARVQRPVFPKRHQQRQFHCRPPFPDPPGPLLIDVPFGRSDSPAPPRLAAFAARDLVLS